MCRMTGMCICVLAAARVSSCRRKDGKPSGVCKKLEDIFRNSAKFGL